LLSGLTLTGGGPAGAAEIGPNDFRISFMGGSGDAADGAFYADAVYNPTADEYLVVWRGDGETAFDGDFEIYGRRVSPAGALLGERLTISQMRPRARVPIAALRRRWPTTASTTSTWWSGPATRAPSAAWSTRSTRSGDSDSTAPPEGRSE
jgi:hypothetical protein